MAALVIGSLLSAARGEEGKLEAPLLPPVSIDPPEADIGAPIFPATPPGTNFVEPSAVPSAVRIHSHARAGQA